MIIWGGNNGSSDLDTGGRYNPNTDNWGSTSTTNAPAARDSHTAIWSGSEMIVWGGASSNDYFNTHGRKILHAIRYANAYSNSDINADCNGNAYCDAIRDADTYLYIHSHSDSYFYSTA